MFRASRNSLDRMRASRLLPALLLLLALASSLSGFHAVSHIDEDADHGALAAPQSQGDSDDGSAAYPLECPVCRLVGAWSFALVPAARCELHSATNTSCVAGALRETGLPTDSVARWQQRLKHGPPQLSC